MRASLTGLFGLAVLWRLALPCDLHAQQTAPGTRLFVCMYESPSSGPADRPAGVRTGLAISADQGATWRNSGWQIGTTNDIAGDPRHPGTLYLGNDWGLLKSTDDGESWRLMTGPRVPAVLSVLATETAVWIASASGPWKSTDGGENWTQIDAGLPPLNGTYCSSLLALGSDILLGTANGAYRNNGNDRWTPSGMQGAAVSRISRHPKDPLALLATLETNELRISRDGGRSWSAPAASPPVKKIQDAVFLAGGTEMMIVASQDAGIVTSNDGGNSWKYSSSGLTNYNITALAYDLRDPAVVYAGSENGSFVTRNRGASWQPFSIRAGYISAIRTF